MNFEITVENKGIRSSVIVEAPDVYSAYNQYYLKYPITEGDIVSITECKPK